MVKRYERRKHARIIHPRDDETPIRFELFSTERLRDHAQSLAAAQTVGIVKSAPPLTPRVNENARVLLEAYKSISNALSRQHAITQAAEWLLDNFHVLEEQLGNLQVDLPESYYRELPKLTEGALAGYPRIYGIAWALVAHTDSRFDPEMLNLFIRSYQQVQPLTLGELWAIPSTLRVILVENLRRLAVRIMRSQAGRELANNFVDQVEELNRNPDRSSQQPLPTGKLPPAPLRQAYAVQFLQRLHDPYTGSSLSIDFMQDWLQEQGKTLEEIVHTEHAEQIADNLTVGNIINSMRAISAFDWMHFIEQVSLVDEQLRAYPGYENLDFYTRDRYRHAIEDLAKKSVYEEVEIAAKVMAKVNRFENHDNAVLREPGYYLIGNGRYAFEAEIHYRPTLKQKLLRWYVAHAGAGYISSVAALTLLLLSLPFTIGRNADLSGLQLTLLMLFSFFPASDIAVGLINRLTVTALSPQHLPRIEFKEDIPADLSTFVVVPTLFSSVQNVLKQVEQLEIRFLANRSDHVYFALLSDWLDAPQQHMPNDRLLLRTAVAAIEQLNRKYGKEQFFVFHRQRLWNPCEGVWMGWERKRGKLHEFNRLLRGDPGTSFLPHPAQPGIVRRNIKYVITLDADTELPPGVVAKLIGVAIHPLNQPVFDKHSRKVVAGYGILQPRVTATLPLRQEYSLFHRIFSGAAGTDAYSSTVSELYQDLFGLGTYSGKGLYHVDAFQAALEDRVPENTQLSHDLFESIFARCALVSDIEFFEEFPSHSDVAASRQHRWVRGDWQLLPWIFGAAGHDMPLLGRWKMLDNLRRSLSAPGAFLSLVTIWCIPGAPHLALLGFVLTAPSLPVILALLNSFHPVRRGVSWRTHIRTETENILWAGANALAEITLLAQQAWLTLDAIISTLIRLFITRRQLLKWVTALQAKNVAEYSLKNLLRPILNSSSIVVCTAALILFFNPDGIWPAMPFLWLWWLAPVIARLLSLPPRLDEAELLQPQDSEQLRLSGRRIWRFFTTFVNAAENYLPPDNFQEDPAPVIAHRSSPTNFGLYLLSVIAARDFGWSGLLDTVVRLEATLTTLQELPRLNGHFYNWYDTRDLHVLEPRYISTVDSGNLAGHLLTLAQAVRELLHQPISLNLALSGLTDTWQLLAITLREQAAGPSSGSPARVELDAKVRHIGKLLSAQPADCHGWHSLWEELHAAVQSMAESAARWAVASGKDPSQDQLIVWATLLLEDVNSHFQDQQKLLPWLANRQIEQSWCLELERIIPMIETHVPVLELESYYQDIIFKLAAVSDGPEINTAVTAISQAIQVAQEHCRNLVSRLYHLEAQIEKLAADMDFKFLYDQNRAMFALGYNVNEHKLDGSYYDLLASEARLASFVAIAKKDVPYQHWFHLGRRVTRVENGTVLLSWSGSMFEYLMPSLVMYTPRYSLLDQTCRLIIKRQISYGQERQVPWGISESALNRRDLAFTYQYSAFGVPGLGMKRGLGEELVVAPYATALAAMYFPHEAVENLQRLAAAGALGSFGFYEALDYTPARLAENQQVAPVRCYMAHHQGMSLIAYDNAVHDGIMRHRFHRNPLIRAAELLLEERIPHGADTSSVPLLQALAEVRESAQPPILLLPSLLTSVPATHLLSNGRYAVMLTGAGSGYSQWQNLQVTRWREDVTCDSWGSYIYLRDNHSGKVWSAGYQPTAVKPDHYHVVFVEDRVRITRHDDWIESILEIVVSPEDDAEIRRLTLINNGTEDIALSVTSYAELVLTSAAADRAHPAFSNLFVRTEYLPEVRALLAERRPRSAKDPHLWAAHILAATKSTEGLQYETERSHFIGRGQTLRRPLAIMDGRALGNNVGEVLDPIFSLRTQVVIAAGNTEQLVFSTLVADTRENLMMLIDKYHNSSIWDRVSSLAWAHAQVQLHHLRITRDEALLFQSVANRLLYIDPALRAYNELKRQNVLNVGDLWRLGISGDRPILLLRVSQLQDRSLVDQMLRAHEYWHMKGLAVDLIILNEKESSYLEDLQNLLEKMVHDNHIRSFWQDRDARGGIFVLRANHLSAQEIILLQTLAKVILLSSKGTLSEQMLRHPKVPVSWVSDDGEVSDPQPDTLPVPELEFFNGLGGFAEQGAEYVVVLDKGQTTPAPWVNIIANPQFGFMVSESGSGFTWSVNSRENQLTPWSNDPVCDPSGEVFYIRDQVSNALWTPTALPICIPEARYITRHGQGYSRFEHSSHGIRSDLLQFVSTTDPVKISVLTLTNLTGATRYLTVAAYVEWVLGSSRSVSLPHLITELDPVTRAVLATNPFDKEFGRRIAFADLSGLQTHWTGNRTEFIGRHGSLSAPAGLRNGTVLKNRLGANLDPCTALTTDFKLPAGGSIELVFLLGQGEDRADAARLITRYRTLPVAKLFADAKRSWDELLEKIQVTTPNPELDILLNRWALYQTLSCRIWARAAFYQAGGAFGFRDQLQDSMALAVARPDLARQQLLTAAARQFLEGDVQHWWHVPTGRGVRTHFSDDRLWLVFAVCHYLDVTGDDSVLDMRLPFLDGPPLAPEQEDAYFEPTIAKLDGSLFEHCARAIEISLSTGSHGLPLMGSGDWNDGMNRVGIGGQGESVWMAWFLLANLKQFALIAEQRGETHYSLRWQEHATQLKQAVEAHGWDGAWYRRAYFDDGTPLGAAANAECRIDSLAQSWAVISGWGDPARSEKAMQSVKDYLIREGDSLVLLFTPPFIKGEPDPGYVKSYPPGVRENGGQYTHAAVWAAMAYALLGQGDQALEVLEMLNPIYRTRSKADLSAYRVEPYVVAADVYAEPPHNRRGGWTWYTGAAGWFYRTGLESVLGLQVRGDKLIFKPCIPKIWPEYQIMYRHHSAHYHIDVQNPEGVSSGIKELQLDSKVLNDTSSITLVDDGQAHEVRILLG